MTRFFALLRLQLLSRYADLKPANLKTAFRDKKGRTIGTFIAVLFLIVYLGGMLFFLETKLIDILMEIGSPDMLISLAVMVSMGGTLIMAFFFILSSLFLGRDGPFLAAMPLKPRLVLSAKLAQVWLSETGIDALIILPAGILFGVKTGMDMLFYFRLLVVWLLISVIPIALVTFVSSLLIRLSALWRHREIMTTVFGLLFMVLYMFFCMNIGGMTGDAENSGEMLRAFAASYTTRIDMLTGVIPPAGWAAKGLLGNWGQLLLYVGVSLAAAAFTIYVMGFFYRKLALLQSETPHAKSGKRIARGAYSGSSALKACCMREIKSILRVPSYVTNILPICFMPVLIIIMMSIAFSRSAPEGSSGLGELLASLDKRIVMGILTAVIAYMGGMNPALSTAVTREGKGHIWLTALPVPGRTMILAKFIVGYGLSFVGILAACIALCIIFPVFIPEIIMSLVLNLLFSLLCDAITLKRDIRKPKLDWVTEQEAVKQNFGVLIAMLLSWFFLITLGVLTYFLISWGVELLPLFAILAAILAAGSAIMWKRMMSAADKYYCAA